jgi:hypothetical protein
MKDAKFNQKFVATIEFNKKLVGAIGQIILGLNGFEDTAKNCPDRMEVASGKYCKRGSEMDANVMATFHCTPCLWAFCPRVSKADRKAEVDRLNSK